MSVRVDAIGNVLGRYEGTQPGQPALMLGSHLDTVENAGRYDGILGVITAINCVARFHKAKRRFPFALEVIGFCDEEGLRFGTTMLGSRAVAGTFDPASLGRTDQQGFSLEQALAEVDLDSRGIAAAKRRRDEILAYVELHIEQGPVLENAEIPIGCVTSIAGATRLEVDVMGEAGHAGTVPMNLRRDALAAAAECVLAIEDHCRQKQDVVGTVGCISAAPGAINVIPGAVRFTIDLRSGDDAQRRSSLENLTTKLSEIGRRRNVAIASRVIHSLDSTPCADWLIDGIDRAITQAGVKPLRLASGAGHDAMAMHPLTDVGMIFVRCEKGISHSPAEAISPYDAGMGAWVMSNFIENFAPRGQH